MKNLSQIALDYGVRLDNWMRLKSAKTLIANAVTETTKPPIIVAVGRNLSQETKQLLQDAGIQDIVQGTYASDDIAASFVKWCQKDTNTKPSFIYFIRGDHTNTFKVGISSEPRSRLKNMQTGCPVKLILSRSVEVKNTESVEKELHKAFSKYKIHGEWFSMPWKNALKIFDSIVSS